jgi:hypothetical protein
MRPRPNGWRFLRSTDFSPPLTGLRSILSRNDAASSRLRGQMNQQFGPLHDLNLGAPCDHSNYVPRGRTWFCCASLRRRYRLAAWPRHLQSTETHRPDRNDLAPGAASSPTFAVFIWLCKAGPGQLSGIAQSTTRHGVRRGGRPEHEHYARRGRRAVVPPCWLLAGDCGAMGC